MKTLGLYLIFGTALIIFSLTAIACLAVDKPINQAVDCFYFQPETAACWTR